MVSQIARIEVQVTRSETEALLLENSLIKTLRPKYNVLMRDDKSYPFLYLSLNHAYPSLTSIRSKKKPEKGCYFGPFPSLAAVKETLNTIQKVFKIRNCTDSYFSSRTRPCLQYEIARCSAPCTAYISQNDYQLSVNLARQFLEGKGSSILDDLALRMQAMVAKQAFEEAAVLRDQIKHLRLIQEQQGVVQLSGDVDVVVLEVKPGFACVLCLTIRQGQVISQQRFFPSVPKQGFEEDSASLWQTVFTTFIHYYYLAMPSRIPGTLLTNHVVDDKAALQTLLSEARQARCLIQSKPRGVNARWLDFALNNLKVVVDEQLRSSQRLEESYAALAEFLHLQDPIERMECFDISHTQGQATVASCVVFNQHGPCKREYRTFNITGITPGDDYAAMRQALMRRFKRLLQEQNLPTLLIIDGGKGQVKVAQNVLDELGIHRVIILGVAKGADRKAGRERLILASSQQEIALVKPPQSCNYCNKFVMKPIDLPLKRIEKNVKPQV